MAALIEKHTGERIRFFLLRTHYRSTVVFDDEGLEEAGQALTSFYRLIGRFERISGLNFFEKVEYAKRRVEGDLRLAQAGDSDLIKSVSALRKSFLDKMDDDFNTGGAVSDLFELARTINRHVDETSWKSKPNARQNS